MTSPLDAAAHEGIVLTGASKTFGLTKVLHDISLTFAPGTVTGVLGENGAGKSTLFKILAGIYEPDAGATLRVNGKEASLPLTPTSSANLGFAFVHQDLGLAGSLSVTENVFVGAMMRKRGLIDWKAQKVKVRELLAGLGVDVDPATPVQELTQAEKAVVAIARAVYARGRERSSLLVLDEPTANLTGVERDRLFEAMRAAAASGTAIAFCTHRLDEVLTATDSVLVLRDGSVVMQAPTSTISGEKELAKHILGRDLESHFPERTSHFVAGSEPAIRINELSGGGINGLSLDIRPGEVVGLTGLAGAGHDDVPDLILGSMNAESGTVSVGGKKVKPSSATDATAAGIAMLPADRKRRSGIMGASIAENLTLVSIGTFTRRGLIDARAERRSVVEAMEQFDVRPMGDPDRPLETLSGGNQQKVLIAKWAAKAGVKCLILHEPTQGVDVGAKRTVLEHVRRMAEQGVAVLLVSSEHEELSHLCDRVLIMRGGLVRREMVGATAKQITEQCYVAA
ncbi:sugar ABC transporter ATP-binding protein [Paeniglutamicibacter kerguelensis]|uniref:Ribose transport system ATP-binding protein n=1 Tax=Paeniglutamicibacter kerguelensis TaxID=254788 RepID=A0ABS4XIY0_9MICC|nr:sugar ABC transporter ATP-binding protein [Paeniglutamicibacter kerguelensis]MBP2388415.1 ribose transport system ATP-binding protein [Paeniglutamicibacter kerguelensis]